MSKKYKIILICLVVAVVLIVGITVPLVLLKQKDTQLLTPNPVEVAQSENLIVFKTSKVENAVEYMFEVSIPGRENATSISSETNELVLDFTKTSSLKTEFNVAGIYSVQCYAIAENEKDNSYKSAPTNFTRTVTLESPTIYKTKDIFKWETVKNATAYEIVISSTTGTELLKVEATTDVSIAQEEISISNIKNALELDVGSYTISVRAINETNSYYKTSMYSSALEFSIN